MGIELLERLRSAGHGNLFASDPDFAVAVVDADPKRLANRPQMLVSRPKQREDALWVGQRDSRFGHSAPGGKAAVPGPI
jgi:hypothetical protein